MFIVTISLILDCISFISYLGTQEENPTISQLPCHSSPASQQSTSITRRYQRRLLLQLLEVEYYVFKLYDDNIPFRIALQLLTLTISIFLLHSHRGIFNFGPLEQLLSQLISKLLSLLIVSLQFRLPLLRHGPLNEAESGFLFDAHDDFRVCAIRVNFVKLLILLGHFRVVGFQGL